jgi:hypothetical protein
MTVGEGDGTHALRGLAPRKINDALFAGLRSSVAELASEYTTLRDVTLFGDGGLARFIFARAYLAPEGGSRVTRMENPCDASLGEVTSHDPTPLARRRARFVRCDRHRRARH